MNVELCRCLATCTILLLVFVVSYLLISKDTERFLPTEPASTPVHYTRVAGTSTNSAKAAPTYTSTFAETQRQRQKLLADTCSKYFPSNRRNTTDLTFPKKHFYVNKRPRYLYCLIPKVASTNWKRTLSRANGAGKHLDVQSQRVLKYLTRLGKLSQQEQEDTLKTHFKFMFVRHPFERLVSGHRDKFLQMTPGRRDAKRYFDIADRIKRTYRRKRERKGPPTFKEFAQFIVDRKRVGLNNHWRPQHQVCHPCKVHYDFIGHYETLEDDVQFVLKKLGIDKKVQFPESSQKNSSASAIKIFSELPNGVVARLRRVYAVDFALFGYKYNKLRP